MEAVKLLLAASLTANILLAFAYHRLRTRHGWVKVQLRRVADERNEARWAARNNAG